MTIWILSVWKYQYEFVCDQEKITNLNFIKKNLIFWCISNLEWLNSWLTLAIELLLSPRQEAIISIKVYTNEKENRTIKPGEIKTFHLRFSRLVFRMVSHDLIARSHFVVKPVFIRWTFKTKIKCLQECCYHIRVYIACFFPKLIINQD